MSKTLSFARFVGLLLSGLCALVLLSACSTATTSETSDGQQDIGSQSSALVSVTSIGITPMSPALRVSLTAALKVTAVMSDGTTKTLTTGLTWTSSNAGVVSVNASGRIKGMASGNATVTVTHTSGATASTPVSVGAARLVSISATPAVKAIAFGGTQTYVATGIFEDRSKVVLGSSGIDAVVWSSSATNVAVISSAGLASAVSPGTTTITATHVSSGIVGSATLKVNPPTLTRLAVTPASATLPVGTRQALTVMATYSDNTTTDVTTTATWASSSPAFATVDPTGSVSAIAAGVANVTATFGGRTSTARITVKPVTLTSIVVSSSSLDVPIGTHQKFVATGHYNDASVRDLTEQVTWTSSAATVASVSNAAGTKGDVAGLRIGNVTLTARDPATNVRGTAPISVSTAAIRSIAVSSSAPSSPAGIAMAFHADATYTDGSHRDVSATVTWSTTGAAATVSNAAPNHGEVVGQAVGQVVVHAYDASSGVEGTATLSVSAALLRQVVVTPAVPSVSAGETISLLATGIYSDGSHTDITKQVSWSSSAPAIADVSNAPGAEGVVSSFGAGTTDMTGIDPVSGIRGSTTVTVTAARLVELTLNEPSLRLPLGLTANVFVSARYSDGHVVSSSSSPTFASSLSWSVGPSLVNLALTRSFRASYAALTAIAVGNTTLTVTDPATGVTSSVPVSCTAAEPASIRLVDAPFSPSMAKGTHVVVHAVAVMTDGSSIPADGLVTYSIDAPLVADLVNDPVAGATITARGVGQTVLTLSTANGTTWSYQVIVVPAAITRAYLSPSAPSMAKGTSLQIRAFADYTDGTTEDWTSQATWTVASAPDAPSVATVDNTPGVPGLVTGLTVGGAVLSARHPVDLDKVATTPLAVTPATLVSIAVSYVSLPLGSQQTLYVDGTFSDGTTGPVADRVTWATTDPSISVTPGGILTSTPPHAIGPAGTVTAFEPVTGLQSTANVVLLAPVAAELVLDVAPSTLSLGSSTLPQGHFAMTDGTTQSASVRCSSTGAVAANGSAIYGVALGMSSVQCFATFGSYFQGNTIDLSAAPFDVSVTPALPAPGRSIDFIPFLQADPRWLYGHGNLPGQFEPFAPDADSLVDGGRVQQSRLTPSSDRTAARWLSNRTSTVVVDAWFSEGFSYQEPCNPHRVCYFFSGCAIVYDQCRVGSISSVAVSSSIDGVSWTSTVNVAAGTPSPATYPSHAYSMRPGDFVQFDVGGQPAMYAGLIRPVNVATAPEHTCSVHKDGSLTCWGKNSWGRLGDGTQTNRPSPTPVVTPVGSGASWFQVSANTYNTCAIRTDGTLWCWGNGSAGMLGTGNQQSSTTPVEAGHGRDWVEVSVGELHTCARDGFDDVYCWGWNTDGQVGGSPGIVASPRFVDHGYANVIASGNHTCGIKRDGTLWCWGSNDTGVIALGANVASVSIPTPIPHATAWRRFSSDRWSSCAIDASDALWCWGYNGNAALGDGTSDTAYSPIHVGDAVRDVGVVDGRVCTLDNAGTLGCRGGQPASWDVSSPTTVNVPGTWAGFSNGGAAVCAFDTTGALYCWGINDNNAVGVPGSGTFVPTPQLIYAQ